MHNTKHINIFCAIIIKQYQSSNTYHLSNAFDQEYKMFIQYILNISINVSKISALVP